MGSENYLKCVSYGYENECFRANEPYYISRIYSITTAYSVAF